VRAAPSVSVIGRRSSARCEPPVSAAAVRGYVSDQRVSKTESESRRYTAHLGRPRHYLRPRRLRHAFGWTTVDGVADVLICVGLTALIVCWRRIVYYFASNPLILRAGVLVILLLLGITYLPLLASREFLQHKPEKAAQFSE
jgi:hypothetical protein